MSGRSYTGDVQGRQLPLPLLGAALLLAISVSGCARLGLADVSDEHTGSIAKSAAMTGDKVDPSDWRMVKDALGRIPPDKPTGAELAWQNPQTGSDGRITALAAMARGGGPSCRAFATTINDLRGIRRYRGQACQTAGGDWQLTQVAVDDGTSL